MRLPQSASSEPPDINLLLLAGIAGVSPFAMSILVPALPAIGTAMNSAMVETQLLISAYLIGLGLFQPLQGPLCDRFGRRPVLLSSLTLFLLASLAAAASTTLDFLVGARLAQAAGSSVCTVVSRAVIRDLYSGDRAAAALSTMASAMGLAPLMAPPLGGWLVETASWRHCFFASALLAAALIAWALLRLPETLAPEHRQPIRPRSLLRVLGALLRARAFVGFTLVFAFGNGAFFTFLAIAPELFASRYATTPSRFGLYWAGLSTAYLLGAAVPSKLAVRLGAPRLFRYAITLLMLAAAVFPFLTTRPMLGPFAVLLPMGVVTFTMGVLYPLSLAGAVDPYPQWAGTASGLASALGMLLSAGFTTLAGAFYDGSGRALGWGVAAGALGCLLGWFLVRNVSQSRPPTESAARGGR